MLCLPNTIITKTQLLKKKKNLYLQKAMKKQKPEVGGGGVDCLDRRLDRRFFFFSLSPSQFGSTTDCWTKTRLIISNFLNLKKKKIKKQRKKIGNPRKDEEIKMGGIFRLGKKIYRKKPIIIMRKVKIKRRNNKSEK